MPINPIIYAAIREQLEKQSGDKNKKREEKAARERAMEAMKFNAAMAERAAGTAQTMTAKEFGKMVKATRVKPKSKKTYGKKNYTNAKGYPRKPKTYG